MKNKKLLVLWLDALSPDKITRESTPFIHSLAQKHQLGTHHPVFGFTGIGAAFYTGKTPVETDQFCLFRREQSKLNRTLSLLPTPLASILFNLQRVATGETFLAKVPDRRILKNFDLAQNFHYNHPHSLPYPTLLNLLDEQKINYLDYNWPYLVRDGRLSYDFFYCHPDPPRIRGRRISEDSSPRTQRGAGAQNDKQACTFKRSFLYQPDDQTNVSRFLNLSRGKGYQVLLLHLYELDKIGHKFGPDSTGYTEHLQAVDNLTREIFNTLIRPENKFLIWSDHGMLRVQKVLNLENTLPKSSNYLYFLDSTLARFWFENNQIKTRVLAKLSKIPNGHVLSPKEKIELGINFPHNKYCEEIFLTDPGVLICPNIFQKTPIKGMHGYNREFLEERGFFISNFMGEGNVSTTQLHSEVRKEITHLHVET